MIWAVIDAFLNTIFFSGLLATVGLYGPHYWMALVILADVLLAVGALKMNVGMMVFWQVIMMIQIVLLFIMWLGLPIIVILTFLKIINVN